MLNGRHRVLQPEGDVLVEVELSEEELAGRAFRRPVQDHPNGETRPTNGDGHLE